MGKPAVPLRYKLISLCAAALLACGLAPFTAFADGDGTVAGPLAGPGYEDDARSASTDSSADDSQQVSASQDAGNSRVAPMLASGLFGSPAGIICSDVALNAADPVIGSFTVDGLTYAVNDGNAMLVAVDAAASDGALDVPASVIYNGIAYDVTAIGPYAFYLSGATDVALPASVASVDGRAFRSSDVERVEVDPGNPNIASFDGCLYDSQLLRLLLIPEGRKGSVLLSCETEVVEASLFSHCSLVEAIAVEEGGAAFSSWNDCLYTADGTTLLRVPAGATDITIRDGCATIAAGALEGCAKLERINAPASVTSISPDLFESVPTVSLPIAAAMQVDSIAGPLAGPGYEGDARSASADSAQAEGEAEVAPRRVVASSQGGGAEEAEGAFGSEVPTSPQPPSASSAESADTVASSLLDQTKESTDSVPQLTAMVALSSTDDDLPEVSSSSIEVALPKGANASCWEQSGFVVIEDASSGDEESAIIALQSAQGFNANTMIIHANGHALANTQSYWVDATGSSTGTSSSWRTGVDEVITYGGANCWYARVGVLQIDHLAGSNGIHQTNHFSSGTPGWTLEGFSSSANSREILTPSGQVFASGTFYAVWTANSYAVELDGNGGKVEGPTSIAAVYGTDFSLASASRIGYGFIGWNTEQDGSGDTVQPGAVKNLTTDNGATVTLYAQWEPYEISFDVDSEPGDIDYPGEAKEPVSGDSVGPDGTIVIEDPKRPGYVFEGWVIPNGDGTEAVDQELVYQGDDGKWYVDASKLPDYVGDDGRVELTARWTSVISVDVPSSVTFYADLVTQGQESREGAAEGAFGQSKVSNQSQVDLRVVGLESSAVKTTDSTLGADSILKKADAATPSSSTQKLLSLYPSTKQWKPEDLQDPDAVGGSKATTAVDFDLDDILLEKSFKADDFTIAAGDTLNMGYRLNLSETGQQLDYDKLSTLSEGQSASIATVSYTFAGDAPLGLTPSGDETDPLYVTVDQAFITANGLDGKAQPGTYGLADIKAAAEDIASKVTVQPPAAGATTNQVAEYWSTVQQQASQSSYYPLYKALLDKQVMDKGAPIDSNAPYFQLKVGGVYLPLQLIGIAQDTKSDGTGKAGLTFQMRDIYAQNNTTSNAAGGGTFNTCMNPSDTTPNGWGRPTDLRSNLRSTFWGYLPAETQAAIEPVDKYQQLYGGASAACLQKTLEETVWLPSTHEIYGASLTGINESEGLTTISGYAPFQYMAYQPGGTSNFNTKVVKTYNGSACPWWLRSVSQKLTMAFSSVFSNGICNNYAASMTIGAAPAFCL